MTHNMLWTKLYTVKQNNEFYIHLFIANILYYYLYYLSLIIRLTEECYFKMAVFARQIEEQTNKKNE